MSAHLLQSPRAIEALACSGACRVVHTLRWLGVAVACFLASAVALGQDQRHPLKPPDRSSPRATLMTFLDSGDALGAFMARQYLPSPSRAKFHRLTELGGVALRCLDLSGMPPAARPKEGRAAALALYEILSRIPLPPPDQIPGDDQVAQPAGTGLTYWVIPNTGINLVRMKSGPQRGQFLFSPDTVARAVENYARVRGFPYARPVPLENLHDIVSTGGGWMVPQAWIDAMPAALRIPLADQAGWKWIGFALLLGIFVLVVWLAYRLSRLGGSRHAFLKALAQFSMPATVLLATPAVAYLALIQLLLVGDVGSAVEIATTAIMYVAGAWMSWRLAPVVAEAIIASPGIASEGIDAHLIRVTARLLGIVGSATLLTLGANRLGIPVYGIVAGLGVGGLAIALAAQPTIENLIGGLNLFADKPIRVGEFCRYGDALGTVEAIGIRSTRIRGFDRTLTTIPNAVLAKMPIVNLTRRDQMLIRTVIGLRYETTPEQLRYVLVKLRELLLGHPRVHPEPARARFIGFGASSLDIELFAYVMTPDWNEFLGIREDILLHAMDIIEQGGASIAFPSQTLYLGRDRAPDDETVQAAEARVRAWREEGALPMPNFTADQARRIRGSVNYPPPGSPDASPIVSASTVPTQDLISPRADDGGRREP
jgi:MscS family membrane protein